MHHLRWQFFLWPLIVLHNEGEVAAIRENLLRWLEVGPLAKKVALRSDDTVCSPGLHRCCWQVVVHRHDTCLQATYSLTHPRCSSGVWVGDIIPCWWQVSFPFRAKASGLARSPEASLKCMKHWPTTPMCRVGQNLCGQRGSTCHVLLSALLTSWWISPSLSLRKPDSHHPEGTWD